MVLEIGGEGEDENGGNSWCLHQAISITLFRMVGGGGLGGIGCMLAEPQQLPCSGIGFLGTCNTVWDVS